MNIGETIKKIRIQQKRTQQEVADACGYTKGLLSKIENMKVTPSIAALSKIAKVLGVKVSVLLESDKQQSVAFNPNEFLNANNFQITDKGYSIFIPAAEYMDKKMQPTFIIAKKEKVKKHLLSHDGEEFVYIIKGKIKLRVGNTDYFLSDGESLYFDAIQLHGIQEVIEETHYLNIFI